MALEARKTVDQTKQRGLSREGKADETLSSAKETESVQLFAPRCSGCIQQGQTASTRKPGDQGLGKKRDQEI